MSLVSDERRQLRVGAALLVLVAVAVVGVVLLDGVHLRSGFHVNVYFQHAGALEEGADVQVAGRVIGTVQSIALVTAKEASDPSHPLYPTGGVACNVRIERRFRYLTRQRGALFVSSKGIIGTAFLEQGPPDDGGDPGPPLDDGDAIRGVDPPRMDRVMMRSYQNLLISRAFLSDVAPEAHRLGRALNELADTLETVEQRPGDFAAMAQSTRDLSTQLEAVQGKWDRADLHLEDVQALAAKARQTIDRTKKAMADIRAKLDELDADTVRLRAALPRAAPARFRLAIDKTRKALAKIDHISAMLDQLSAMVARGEGNIGGLTHDPEFSDYAKKIGKILKRTPWRVLGTMHERK